MRSALATAVGAALLLTSLTACGDESTSTGSATNTAAGTGLHVPGLPGVKKTKDTLSQAELDATILSLNDMPPGWTQEREYDSGASSSSPSATSSRAPLGCPAIDNDPALRDEKQNAGSAGRRFLKGPKGSASEAVQVIIQRFQSEADAKVLMTQYHTLAEKCPTVQLRGTTTSTVSELSTAKVGDDRVGVRMVNESVFDTRLARVGNVVVTVMSFTPAHGSSDDTIMLTQAEKVEKALGRK